MGLKGDFFHLFWKAWGYFVDPKALTDAMDQTQTSALSWPAQSNPGPTAWKEWCEFLNAYLFHTDFSLRQSLGLWLHLQFALRSGSPNLTPFLTLTFFVMLMTSGQCTKDKINPDIASLPQTRQQLLLIFLLLSSPQQFDMERAYFSPWGCLCTHESISL